MTQRPTNRRTCARRRRHAAMLLAWLMLAIGHPALATTPIPYAPAVRSAIETAFLGPDGLADATRVGASRAQLERKRRFIYEHVRDYERRIDDRSKRKARKKGHESDTAVALDHALELLARLELEDDVPEAYRLGAEILTIDFATRMYQYPLASIQTPVYIGNMLVDWDVDGRTREGDGPEEAANLIDPATGEFYTPDELDDMIGAGVDLSTLDPPGDGLLWRPVDPATTAATVRDAYLGDSDALHQGLRSISFPPDGALFELEKIRMTQTKPKIDAWWIDPDCEAMRAAAAEPIAVTADTCRRLYKLKFGGESHSDPVVNALMRMLGYNTDVSMHIKRPRVVLSEGETLETFRRDWENYFDRQDLWTRIALDKALLPNGAGVTRNEGGDVLHFVSAGIEAKPDEIVRVGGWSNGLIDRSALATGMREARALAIFDVWVANTDLKDSENNKVVLRPGPDGRLRMHLLLQDAGNALGLVLAERADAFSWNVVEQGPIQKAIGRARGRIELDFFALQDTGLLKHATHADLKWGVRLIAALPKSRIAEAVALGRFPGGIGALYVEKLANRRNQLVEAFGLGDEFAPLPVDRRLTTPDRSVVNGEVERSEFPEETTADLGHHWRDTLIPAQGFYWNLLRSIVARAVSSVDSVGGTIQLDGVGFDLFPEVLLSWRREVVPNPSPEGELDRFIVEDSFTIGARMAVGNTARGRVTFARRYRLAYPMPSAQQGRFAGNQALNWFLPISARRERLPEHYVLLRDTEYGPGFQVGAPDPNDRVTAGGDAAIDTLMLRRTALEHRREGDVVWLSGGPQVRASGGAWLKVYLLRVTFFEVKAQVGAQTGDVYRFEREVMGDDELDAARAALLRSRSRRVRDLGESLGRRVKIRSQNVDRGLDLVFFDWRQGDRRDVVRRLDDQGDVVARELQIMHRRSHAWRFVDNGELAACRVDGFLDLPVTDAEREKRHWKAGKPVVMLSFLISDENAHSDEMNRYHAFLSNLGGGAEIMAGPFEARDWEQTRRADGRWGRVIVEARLGLSRKAMNALMAVDDDAVHAALADRLGYAAESFDRVRARLVRSTGKQRMIERRRLPPGHATAILATDRALRGLRRARDAERGATRLRRIAHALRVAGCSGSARADASSLGAILAAADWPALTKSGEASVRGRISTAVEDETKLPERRDLVAHAGKHEVGHRRHVVAEPFGPVELYDMLGWTREAPVTTTLEPGVLR